MKWMYNLMYRYPFISIPWDTGPRSERGELLDRVRIAGSVLGIRSV